jgi:RNA polymerase sigma factor (sigma-70 family)
MNADHLLWTSLNRPELRERLVRVARRCGAANLAEAEDCVQDALVSAVVTSSSVQDLSRADSWLLQIVANAARMKVRARKRVRRGGGVEHQELFEEMVAHGSTPEQLASAHETLAELEAAIRADRDGELLGACLTWEGTLDSLAETRGENVSAIKTRLRRLRARLRAVVEAA